MRNLIAMVVGLALLAVACGDSSATDGAPDGPTVVVTTSILGDVVANLLGDHAEVVTIMPTGADPHEFQASAQQVARIGDADLLIANGAGFEQGLLDVVEAARDDGVPTFEVISAVDTIAFGAGAHDHEDEDHEDEDHDGDDHGEDDDGDDQGDEDHEDDDHGNEDHEDHDHGDEDPHFFTDPGRMAIAAEAIVEFFVAEVDDVDADDLRADAAGYIDELEALDRDMQQILEAIPPQDRVLVTNHEVFGYFADRYGFEVVGTVIPAGTTVDGVSAGELAALAELIEADGVPAIFADTSATDELAETLAAEVGDVAVVELYSESLGAPDSDGATYLQMMRTNAERIAEALAG